MAKKKLLGEYYVKSGGNSKSVEDKTKIDFYDGVLNVHRQPGVGVANIPHCRGKEDANATY